MFTVLLVTLCVLCSCTVQSTHLSWNQLRQNARHGTYVSSDRSIRILRLDVPTAVRNGSAIYLGCHFDLQGETLYSVKWYRNYVEFFRFLPVNIPRPGQPVKLKGAFVDARLSNSTHVFLYRTDLDSEGTYTCEVTTDSPTYATVRAEQQMKVYVLPEDKPYIEGAEMPFDVGDTINLTCVSAASRPAPIMSWFVNGHMAPLHQIVEYPIVNLPDGLQSRKLGLVVQAIPELFPNGHLRLRCSSELLFSHSLETSRVLIGGVALQRTSSSNGLHLNKVTLITFIIILVN